MASLLKILRGQLATKTPLVTDRAYKLIRPLRKHVWIGYCDTVGTVVLKLAKSEDFPKFEREVRFQIDFLGSKHVRRILDVIYTPEHDSVEDFRLAMVLEFKHWSLWDACVSPKSTSLNGREIDLVMKGALQGLSDLHEKGVAHLDIKPGNILVNNDLSHADLCDLRAAHEIPSGGWLDSSQMRGSFYTPTYRPPEVFQLGICQKSADVYAAGLLWLHLYQLQQFLSMFTSGLYQNDATQGGTISKIKDSQYYDFGLADLPFYQSINSWPPRALKSRDNEFEGALLKVPEPLRVAIRAMMNPEPLKRPTVSQILKQCFSSS